VLIDAGRQSTTVVSVNQQNFRSSSAWRELAVDLRRAFGRGWFGRQEKSSASASHTGWGIAEA
jgi:hypothetical protein